jgi:formylglycine-generating enzyme required for sulfatase activity
LLALALLLALPASPQTPLEFVKIAPGEFTMGCAAGSTSCNADEKPAHRVRITRGFEIGKYEVTQAEWESVMGSNPSYFKGPDLPVEEVSWEDTQQFLAKLNSRHDGYHYRLPTEAEWEYAARAGSAEAAATDAIAWSFENSHGQTHPVGQKQPNAWGLFDTEGNVWEWVQDWHDPAYYRTSPPSDPPGPASGQYRVVRGGSWFYSAKTIGLSFRVRFDPASRVSLIGFRCVREVIGG